MDGRAEGDGRDVGSPRMPWDIDDQIADLERQVARQARRYERLRSVIAEADLLFSPRGATPTEE